MPQIINTNKLYQCFVCDASINDGNMSYHKQVNMPVCDNCKGSDKERQKVNELLEGLADGFVCGCI
ncbi:hypothetical protein [Carboxylicivirga sp. RSCT41]|uniref:hypothetical protein n=1 Tax=Carboxylicivirga agarovorans TaxID=3417570 RepID=UPI003D34DAB2